jgi:hypothetical protein
VGGGARLGRRLGRAARGRAARGPGRVSLGDLALFYQAFQQGQRLMRSLLDGVGQVYTNALFLGNLFEFLVTSRSARRTPAVHPGRPIKALQLPGSTFAFIQALVKARRGSSNVLSRSFPSGPAPEPLPSASPVKLYATK